MVFAIWHDWKPGYGGSLQGYIDITYKELVKKLGSPSDGDGYKTDAEWFIEFEDGTCASIYNYKDGISYNGKREGTPKTKITEWHIGGLDDKSNYKVHELFDRT